jgi:hypothetical protein
MGQYSQWLHYREVDGQLQAQLETLERELAQLQDRLQLLEQGEWSQKSCLSADNKIIHALHAMNAMDAQAPRRNGQPLLIDSTPVPLTEIVPNEPGETISPALFARSNLPNFGPQAVPPETPVVNGSQLTSYNHQLPSIPHREMALLPEDMSSFIEEHTMTDPQIELPWWLRNIRAASNIASSPNGPYGPIDQESIRTNRLVQRWLERWGRQISQQKPGSNNDE